MTKEYTITLKQILTTIMLALIAFSMAINTILHGDILTQIVVSVLAVGLYAEANFSED